MKTRQFGMMTVLAALALTSGAVPSAAFAAPVVFEATLSGAAQSPPVATPGTGTAVVTFDLPAHTLTVSVQFSGLTSETALAHIHCCTPPPNNAGVATPLPTLPGFPAGLTDGQYTMTFDTTQAATFNASFISVNGTVAGAESALYAGLLAGEAYLNIHTIAYPSGEIRGFLTQVPEPAAAALFLVGLAGVVTAQRRGRRG